MKHNRYEYFYRNSESKSLESAKYQAITIYIYMQRCSMEHGDHVT